MLHSKGDNSYLVDKLYKAYKNQGNTTGNKWIDKEIKIEKKLGTKFQMKPPRTEKEGK